MGEKTKKALLIILVGLLLFGGIITGYIIAKGIKSKEKERDAAIAKLLVNKTVLEIELEEVVYYVGGLKTFRIGGLEIYRVVFLDNQTIKESLIAYNSSAKEAFFVKDERWAENIVERGDEP